MMPTGRGTVIDYNKERTVRSLITCQGASLACVAVNCNFSYAQYQSSNRSSLKPNNLRLLGKMLLHLQSFGVYHAAAQALR